MNFIKKTAISTAAALTATAATVAAKAAKDKDYCPLCEAKKLINKAYLNEGSDFSYNNGVALIPPMGWSSWNLFRHRINEDIIKSIGDAMDKSGLKDAGYIYVNIDDCWQASERDENGRLLWDKMNFKGGIKNLAQYMNERGLKLGIYSSNGTLTCEDYPASLRHEKIDADTFAEWGVEYFKYDFCHNVKIPEIAPKIFAVTFADDKGVEFVTVTPNDFELKGRARIIPDENVFTSAYVTGLDSRNGSFSVKVNAPYDGEYIMTLHIKKHLREEKFVMVQCGGEEYHIYAPGTKSPTPEGKAQIEVKLRKGENKLIFSNPVGSRMDSAAIQYKLMGRELKRATKEYAEKNGTEEKPIIFSICEWGLNQPWKWGRQAGNLWRTTGDIQPKWASVLAIYEFTARLQKCSAKGGWNDPDMLEVGNGDLTFEENRSHFSLWCMMNAPLILGNDVREFIKEDGTVDTENKVYQILTNKAMIGINQDKLGVQCKRVKTGIVDVLVKPLENSKMALCILNKGTKEASKSLKLSDFANEGILNLPKKNSYKVYDVWEDKTDEGVSTLNANVASHGVKVYIVE
ncbi:MAG: glycoside hydrolase family 27 protein [Clostridia bacterium]|nr:glycoside hydrolase family 27 protein [Clostridia bacterium]